MSKKTTVLLSLIITGSMIATAAIPVLADNVKPPVSVDSTVMESMTEETTTVEGLIKPGISTVEESIEKQESTEEEFKIALASVKKLIKVDDKVYPTFNYSTYRDSTGKLVWNFEWYSDKQRGSVYISYNSAGFISSYHKYGYKDSYKFTFAKQTEAQAQSAAKAFLTQVIGNKANYYSMKDINLYYNSDAYVVTYNIKKGGYFADIDTISIGVDKLTGEVILYNSYNMFDPDMNKFETIDKIISVEEAKKSFIEKIGMELVYKSYYDYEKKTLKIFPVYQRDYSNKNSQLISAISGEIISFTDMLKYTGYGVTKEAASLSDRDSKLEYDGVSFTPAELSSIKSFSTYIKEDEAVKKALKVLGISEDKLSNYEKNVNLNKEYYGINKDQYIWSITLNKKDGSYAYYNVNIDARNGDVLSFNNYPYEFYHEINLNGKNFYELESKYTYEEAKKIVLEKVSEYMSVPMENFKLDDGTIDISQKERNYNFHFIRYYNDVKADFNGIYVNFDAVTGTVTNYNLSWYEDASFPKVNLIIPEEKACEALLSSGDYDVSYYTTAVTDNVRYLNLAYNFYGNLYIDPYTGNQIGYQGEKLNPNDSLPPDYSDVKGHWAEKYITTLLDNGIYAWGGAFEADKAITKQELYSYVSFLTNSGLIPYYNYDFASVQKLIYNPRNPNSITEEEKNKTVSREEAAKIICTIFSYEKFGVKADRFVYPFDEKNVSPENKGYVTILYMLGMIQGDKDGGYDAKAQLTRADTAFMIYSYIIANQ